MNVEFDIDGADVLPATVLDELDGTDDLESENVTTIICLLKTLIAKRQIWKDSTVQSGSSCKKIEHNDPVYEVYDEKDPKPYYPPDDERIQFVTRLYSVPTIYSVECIDKFKFSYVVHSKRGFIKGPTVLSLLHPIQIMLEKGVCYFLILPMHLMEEGCLQKLFSYSLDMGDFIKYEKKIMILRLKQHDRVIIPPLNACIRLDLDCTEYRTSLIPIKKISSDFKKIWGHFKTFNFPNTFWRIREVDIAVDSIFKQYEKSFLFLVDDICTYFVFDLLLGYRIKKFISNFYDIFELNDQEKHGFSNGEEKDEQGSHADKKRKKPKCKKVIEFEKIKRIVKTKLNFGYKFLNLLEIHLNLYSKLLVSKSIKIGIYSPTEDVVEIGLFAKESISQNRQTFDLEGIFVNKKEECLWNLNDFSTVLKESTMGYLVGPLRLVNHNPIPTVRINSQYHSAKTIHEIAIDTELCFDYGKDFQFNGALLEKESLMFPEVNFRITQSSKGKVKNVNESPILMDFLDKIHNSSSIAFLLGSGVSAKVIPTFRGTASARSNKKLMEFNTYRQPSSRLSVIRCWLDIYNRTVNAVVPNFHKLLLKLQHQNKLQMVYTQNVDGFEKKVGLETDKVVYLHGLAEHVWCNLNVDHEYPLEKLTEKEFNHMKTTVATNCLACLEDETTSLRENGSRTKRVGNPQPGYILYNDIIHQTKEIEIPYPYPEIFIVAGTSLSNDVKGARKFLDEMITKCRFLVYLGLQSPPQNYADKFHLIIIMDAEEFADMVSSRLQSSITCIKPSYYKERVQSLDLMMKYYEERL